MSTVSSTRKPNTTSSSYNSLNFVIWQQLAQVNTLEPVLVTAINADDTLDVKPLLNSLSPDNQAVEPQEIYSVPYIRLQVGKNALKLAPQVGDMGLVAYCQRDIAGVMAAKGQANPQSNRRFDNSDAVYIGSIANIAVDPVRFIEINDSAMTIKGDVPLTITAQSVTVNADMTVNGKITATGDVIGGGISLMGHVHAGVTSGPSTTGKAQ